MAKINKDNNKIQNKKAVVTILGIQGAAYDDNGNPYVKNYNHQARYYFEKEDKIKEYYNTLPLLIGRFESKGYEIVPIYTQESKIFNCDVLTKADLECKFFDEKLLIEDEKDYNAIFKKIDSILNEYDSVIVDLTHGFRHLPLLMLIDLIIINFKNTDKVEHIYFAKEILKHTPNKIGEYEIIDLKKYLDIASISYVLSSFEQNYTVSNHIKTVDSDFQMLINMLSKFSEHIMANSLGTLLQSNNSLIEKINSAIDLALEHSKAKPLSQFLQNIQKHLEKFLDLKEKDRYIQLFELAKIMKNKGYFLNSITLLNEAAGWYCAKNIANFSKEYDMKLQKAIKNNRDTYSVIDGAKKIIRFTFNKRNYENKLNLSDVKNIQDWLKEKKSIKKFSFELIGEIDKYRNNLAHANSGNNISDIEKLLEKLFSRFQKYCIKNDILKG